MTKLDIFLKEHKAFCKHHGVHEKWRVYNRGIGYRQVICILCSRVRNNKNRNKWLDLDRSWHNMRSHAFEGKGIDPALTKQKFKEWAAQQPPICQVTRLPFTDTFKQSVDRKDNSKGYYLDNMWFIGLPINYMKRGYTLQEFLQYARAIAKANPE